MFRGSDDPVGFDRERQVFVAVEGGFRPIGSGSDDAEILATIRNHRPEMRFRLTYDGSLKSSGNATRSKEKWEIRRALQPQLEELWEIHPTLQGFAVAYPAPPKWEHTPLWPGHRDPSEVFPPRPRDEQKALLRQSIEVSGFKYLPIVRSSMRLACSLDILFLRRDGPGLIVSNAGDLDNRIKTLFDGLRMPSPGELPPEGKTLPSPFHCLLEDDKLITSLAVRTDRLLSKPGAPADEVRLILDVIVSPTRLDVTNSGFLGD